MLRALANKCQIIGSRSQVSPEMTGKKDALFSLAETAAVSWWVSSQAAHCSRLELLPLEMPSPRW